MGYKCLNCGKITDKIEGKIRCPYCGTRVFTKTRQKIIKRVQAR